MKKIFLMAAAAATLFASCAKEDNGQDISGNDGDSKVSVSFTIPAEALATRADQPAISTAETAIKKAYVFVFDNSGTKASTGGYTVLDATDFADPVAEGDGWKYTQKNAFETVAGNVRIYVGINLPTDLVTGWDVNGPANEAALLAVIEDVEGLWEYTNATTGEFAMFSPVKTPNLPKYKEGDPIVPVEVSVSRVVSKVVTTADKETFVIEWGGTDDVELTYTIKEFNVYNEAFQSYLVEHATTLSKDDNNDDRNDYLYGFDQSYFKNALGTGAAGGANLTITGFEDVAVGNQYVVGAPELTALPGFYIGENKSTLAEGAEGLSRVGNTTYAMVAAQVSVTKFATWVEAAGDVPAHAEWAENGTWRAGDDIFIVKGATHPYTYIAASKTEADKIAVGVGLTTGSVFTYTKGWVHFLVWLNKDKNVVNKADVGRNEFIHLNVNGIVGIDGNGNGKFPGYPGDPTDPEKPIDPSGDDPNNPDPIEPEDPIDGAPAQLMVTITVSPWIYMDNSVTLQ